MRMCAGVSLVAICSAVIVIAQPRDPIKVDKGVSISLRTEVSCTDVFSFSQACVDMICTKLQIPKIRPQSITNTFAMYEYPPIYRNCSTTQHHKYQQELVFFGRLNPVSSRRA